MNSYLIVFPLYFCLNYYYKWCFGSFGDQDMAHFTIVTCMVLVVVDNIRKVAFDFSEVNRKRRHLFNFPLVICFEKKGNTKFTYI